jgi:hypothetical protein
VTAEEIARCEKDPRAHVKLSKTDLPLPTARAKGPRYTPVSKRADKPDAIAYLIKTFPQLLDAQVARLLGTTKDTIAKVRDKSHWNASNIKPRNPVLLGLCKQSDLDTQIKRADRRVAREEKAAGKTKPMVDETMEAQESADMTSPFKDFDGPEDKGEPSVTFDFGMSVSNDDQPEEE